ncbi:GNAT family N-acetyltransferase [Arthrobacter sp. KNU-44]|uniref:GNAT family N-acetyltransferase n=1 Tax=Arthrobacter sp. KNU-44 TaxID=3450744 RepID=UPI003F41C4B7
MKNESFRLRPACPDDARIVQTLLQELASLEHSLEYVKVTTEQWKTLLAREDVLVLLAERAEGVAGYVSVVRRPHLWSGQDVLALDDLYVRADARGQGAGELLMKGIAAVAEREGLTITWGVRLDNEAAQRFYRRMGARLTTKVLASWEVSEYSPMLR